MKPTLKCKSWYAVTRAYKSRSNEDIQEYVNKRSYDTWYKLSTEVMRKKNSYQKLTCRIKKNENLLWDLYLYPGYVSIKPIPYAYKKIIYEFIDNRSIRVKCSNCIHQFEYRLNNKCNETYTKMQIKLSQKKLS